MAAATVVPIRVRRVLDFTEKHTPHPDFKIKTRVIRHKHGFQFTFDHGQVPGPWIKLGLNHTEVAIGFLPR